MYLCINYIQFSFRASSAATKIQRKRHKRNFGQNFDSEIRRLRRIENSPKIYLRIFVRNRIFRRI